VLALLLIDRDPQQHIGPFLCISHMRPDFWKSTAHKHLLIPAWPWIDLASSEKVRSRIQDTLDKYWTGRLDRVPSSFTGEPLGARARKAFAKGEVLRWGGLGYDLILNAMSGDPDAFWFFELGSPAWNVTLDRVRFAHEGAFSREDLELFDEIRSVWRKEGPKDALAKNRPLLADRRHDSPLSLAALVPLVAWEERDPGKAMLTLDQAVSGFPRGYLYSLYPSLPLTYGLLHALSGNLESAERMLTRETEEGRLTIPSDGSTTELSYHRARYLWALGRDEEALEVLGKSIREHPQNALRLFTDPSWKDRVDPRPRDRRIEDAVSLVVSEGENESVRWSQAGRSSGVSDLSEASDLDEILASGYDSPYVSIISASLLDRIKSWERGQGKQSPYFRSAFERLTQFAESMPGDMPLVVGPGYADRFSGGEGSDLDRIDRLQQVGLGSQAEAYMEAVMRDLPDALRLALSIYGQRLVGAIAASVDALTHRAKPEDRNRIIGLVELSEKCMGLIEPLENMPSKVGPELAKDVRGIWSEIVAISTKWRGIHTHSFGKLKLVVGDGVTSVIEEEFRALEVRVHDAAGEGVAGVPVIWKVADGPVVPKESSEVLGDELALSLQGGVTYLPVVADTRLAKGFVEAWILGESERVTIPFEVVEKS
jgi:tetratricopeptide (TPR) repeat protein